MTYLSITSIILLFGYLALFSFLVRKQPETTFYGIAKRARLTWIIELRAADKPILAIQTYRNWLIAISRLSGTALLIAGAMFGLTFHSETYIGQFVLGTETEFEWQIKCLAIASIFTFSFINLLLAMRVFNHFIILLQVPEDPTCTNVWLARFLDQGHMHYALGLRGYYLAIPLSLWFISPAAMALGTVLVLAFLYNSDVRIASKI